MADVPALCCHIGYLCRNERFPDSTHCLTHVLEDRNNKSFVQCQYVHKHGRRCLGVCRVSRTEGLCDNHLREFDRLKKLVDRDTKVRDPSKRSVENASVVKAYNAFKRCLTDEGGAPTEPPNPDEEPAEKKPKVADSWLSSTDDEDDEEDDSTGTGIFGRGDLETHISTTRRDDTEEGGAIPYFAPADSLVENAGVLSEEEVLTVAQKKIMRLRGLYEKEKKLIERLLQERRRKYLESLRREQELYGNAQHEAERISPEEQPLYEKLKCLKRYSKIRGPEALLHQQSLDQEDKKEPKLLPKCVFALQRGHKCGEKIVPLSKYCFKHILSDPSQVLFRACGFDIPDGDECCQEPVFPIKESSMCLLHESQDKHIPKI